MVFPEGRPPHDDPGRPDVRRQPWGYSSAAFADREVATPWSRWLIPQIILAGVIAPLSGFGKFLGYALITCYWGRRALESLLPEATLSWLPEREELMVGPQLLMVLVHAGVFVAVTVGLLWYQARLQRLMARWGK